MTDSILAENLLAIYRHLPDCLFHISVSGRIEEFHEGTCGNPFDSAKSLVGRGLLEVLPLGSDEDLRKMISQAIEGRTVITECRLPDLHDGLCFETRLFCYADRKLLVMARDITERKRAKSAVLTAEKRTMDLHDQMHEALESITEGFALYDRQDRLVVCNSRYKEVYNESEDLLIPGARFEDHIRESAYRGQVADAVGREEAWVQERTKQHQNPEEDYLQQLGNGRWLQISEHKTKDGGIVGVRTDITERKEAEEALKEREQHFRLFSLSTGDCFWNWDMIAGTVERSSGFGRVFGYRQDEVLPGFEWWSDRIHPDDKKRVIDIFEETVAGEQASCGYEYRFLCKDGSYAVVDDHVCLIRDATGKVVRSLGAMRDITESKKSEETFNALQRAMSAVTGDEFFACVTKTLTDLFDMSDALVGELIEGDPQKIRTISSYQNKQPTDNYEYYLSGAPCETVVGKTFKVYHGKLWEQFSENKFLKTRRIRSYIGVPLLSHAGDPIGVLCAFSDKEQPEWGNSQTIFTLLGDRCSAEIERRQSVEAMRLQQSKLARAGRIAAIGELSSGIIHEISQPLYAVSNFAGACRKTLEGVVFDGAEDVAEYLECIIHANKTAQEIVGHLRSYLSRQEDQQSQSVVALNDVIEEALKLLAFEIRNHFIAVNCDLAPGMTVFINPLQLQQVFVNLILNACEALETVPAENRRIQIRSCLVENEVEVTVEDSGSGISQEASQYVFEPFFTTKVSGMGMGMAITKEIINQHNGKLWFVSPPHKGATFHVSLPVLQNQ